jgi:glycosyltransferase involved in cell wall biosynthesis
MVTRGDLFPPDHGAAVRTVESARALARTGIRVGIVTDNRKHWFEITPGDETPRKYPFWLRLLSLPGPLTKLLHFSKNLPYSNSFLYLPLTDGSFFWRTLAAGKALHAGILQAEFPAYALPCIKARDTLDCRVVLVEHNVEYDRIKEQVDELSAAQYKNLRDIEIDLCNRSDAVVCVSENDRQKLADDGVDPDLLHTVPHGVNLAQFDSPLVVDARGKFAIPDTCPLLVYHGTFSYPPNQEALRIFAEILLPGLEAKGLLCHLLAVGRYPPAVSPHPRIHLSGSVEQVGPWLRAADLSVVPLVDGGGTRMKIIDCFAARLPVISTSKGIEGIPVVPGKHALVLDDWDAVMTAVIELLEQPQKAAELAQEGRSLAESMDWDTAAEKYRSVYASLR